MLEGGSLSFGVIAFSLALVIFLCNGLLSLTVEQLMDKTESLNSIQQETLSICKAEVASVPTAYPAWIQDYVLSDHSKVCSKSTRPAQAKKVKIYADASVHDTQIEPPQHVHKKENIHPKKRRNRNRSLVAQFLKQIQPIPKNKVDITLSINSGSDKSITQSSINILHVDDNTDSDFSDSQKQNWSESSQNAFQSDIPIGDLDVDKQTSNVDDATLGELGQKARTSEEADPSKVEPSEHMPSFDEWKKEKLEEEKKKGPPSSSVVGKVKPNLKKNYAGADCGAKILASNPESHNSNYILNNQRDEYMLNPCQVKIWFVVELCESVQPHTLELANFELYSSLLKDFTIYTSERYPPREWTFLGQYEFVNDLGAQKFPLPDQIFGKYIKVEFSSHHGTEHFCVLSMFRIYGTSMVDEIEGIDTDEQSNEFDDDSPLGKNIPSESDFLVKAKNVVYKIVEKATNVITGGNSYDEGNATEKMDQNLNEIQPQSFSLGINFVLDELNFSNISKLLYELNKTFGLIDYKGSPNYLSLDFLSHLSQILASCSSCNNHISSFVKSSFIESSMACKYLRAIIGSNKFNILCHLFKLYCRPVKQTQISLKNISGHSTLLLNMFRRYFCSSVLKEQSFICTSQSLNETESITSIKHQMFSHKSKLKAQSDDDSIGSSSHVEAHTEGIVKPIGTSPTNNETKAVINSESVTTGSSELNQTSASITTLPHNFSNSFKTQTEVVEESKEQITEQSEFVIPSSTRNSASSSSFILIGTLDEKQKKESSKIQTLPLSTEDNEDASLIQPTRSEVPAETVSSNSEDAISSPNSIALDISTTTEAKASLLPEPAIVENPGVDQSQNTSTNDDSEIPHKPLFSQTIITPTQPSSHSSQNGQQVAGQPNNVVNQEVIAGGQKESIFMRLSNRIKSLELNLSLSSQYLEELSKRYRKQMDQMTEMQKIFNKSMGSLNETSQKSINKTLHLQDKVEKLESHISNLTHYYKIVVLEKESAASKLIQWHIFLVIVELIAFAAIFVACVKFSANNIIAKFNTIIQNTGNGNLMSSACNHMHAEKSSITDIKVIKSMPMSSAESNFVQKESHTISSLQRKNGIIVDNNIIGNMEESSFSLKVRKKNRSKKHSRSQSNEIKQCGYDPNIYAERSARFSIDNSVGSSKMEHSVKSTSNYKHSPAGLLFGHVPKDISMKFDVENYNENKKTHTSCNLNKLPCNKFSILADMNHHENIICKNNNQRRKYF